MCVTIVKEATLICEGVKWIGRKCGKEEREDIQLYLLSKNMKKMNEARVSTPVDKKQLKNDMN